jgi:tetratricopeptide (TPR) repeat protein
VESPRLLLLEGQVRAELGRPALALRWYRRGLAAVAAQADPPEEARSWDARLRYALAKLRLDQGAVAEATVLAHQAMENAEAIGDRLTVAHACTLLGVAGSAAGAPDVRGYYERALALYEAVGDRLGAEAVLNNLGDEAYYSGDLDAAVELYRKSESVARVAGATVSAAVSANNVGEILSDQGRLDEAEAAFVAALATFRAAGSKYVHYAVRNLGIVAHRKADTETARALLEEAREGFRSVGAMSELAETEVRINQLTEAAATA